MENKKMRIWAGMIICVASIWAAAFIYDNSIVESPYRIAAILSGAFFFIIGLLVSVFAIERRGEK